MDKAKIASLKALAFKFLNFGAEPEAQKFEGMKVKGSEMLVDFNPSLEIGSPVLIATGSGSAPATDQTYEFENGVSFVVKDGLIESVISDGKGEPNKEEPKEEELSGEVVTREEYDSLLDRIKALEDKKPEDFSHLPTSAQLEAFTQHLKTVGGVIEELSKISIETPTNIQPDPEAAKAEAFAKVAAHFSK